MRLCHLRLILARLAAFSQRAIDAAFGHGQILPIIRTVSCGSLRQCKRRGLFLNMSPRPLHWLVRSGGVIPPLQSCSIAFLSETWGVSRARSAKVDCGAFCPLSHHHKHEREMCWPFYHSDGNESLRPSACPPHAKSIRSQMPCGGHTQLYSTPAPQPSRTGCTTCRNFPLPVLVSLAPVSTSRRAESAPRLQQSATSYHTTLCVLILTVEACCG